MQSKIEEISSSFIYDPVLYNKRSARQLLPWLFKKIPVRSVVDIGCGIGTWLAVAKELGINDLKGYDHSNYDHSTFVIPANLFSKVDLSSKIKDSRKYDLALCLEVAEHLPDSSADTLIEALCSLSDIVLFSAAIPGQPGQNHINCQWPEYWQQKFQKEGFNAFDIIRDTFWSNEDLEWWYRQNIILFSRSVVFAGYSFHETQLRRLIHPDLYSLKMEKIEELQKIKIETVFRPSLLFACKTLIKSIFVSPFQKLNHKS